MNDVKQAIVPSSKRRQGGRTDCSESNDADDTTENVELFQLTCHEVVLYVEVEVQSCMNSYEQCDDTAQELMVGIE